MSLLEMLPGSEGPSAGRLVMGHAGLAAQRLDHLGKALLQFLVEMCHRNGSIREVARPLKTTPRIKQVSAPRH